MFFVDVVYVVAMFTQWTLQMENIQLLSTQIDDWSDRLLQSFHLHHLYIGNNGEGNCNGSLSKHTFQ